MGLSSRNGDGCYGVDMMPELKPCPFCGGEMESTKRGGFAHAYESMVANIDCPIKYITFYPAQLRGFNSRPLEDAARIKVLDDAAGAVRAIPEGLYGDVLDDAITAIESLKAPG